MSFFSWNDKFSVGVEAIDTDHKILVDLIDQLHDAFVSGKVEAVIDGVLSTLVDYTHFHFDREEQLMAEAGYPGLAEHKLVHIELKRQVEEIRARFRSGQVSGKIGNEMLAFLHDWLYFHILEQDKGYVPFMHKDGGP